jgi:peroxiredoxin
MNIGYLATDFALKDQHDKEFRLSDFRGKKVLLSFHPLAWTEYCAKQMQSLEENFNVLSSLNTVPVGISVDSVPSKKAWADSLKINNLRMLSDFWSHGAISKHYDAFLDKAGISKRENIIVDENGRMVFAKVYDILSVPDIQEVIDFLKKNVPAAIG